MPAPALKSMAKKYGKSVDDAERYWNEAKKQAEKQGFEEGSERFYKYVMSIVKKRLGGKNESRILDRLSMILEEIVSTTTGDIAKNDARPMGRGRMMRRRYKDCDCDNYDSGEDCGCGLGENCTCRQK